MKSDKPAAFLFTPPARLAKSTDLAFKSLKLAAIANRLALEDRSLVKHRTGRAENVAEHSFMLSIVAPILAETLYPDLDANLVTRYATIHDIVEAYVGDTPTHRINQHGLDSKEALEATGLAQLEKDYADMPTFIMLVRKYEAQKVAEARFVRVVDKLMPLLIHFFEEGSALADVIGVDELRANSDARAIELKRDYPEFTKLVELREELAGLAISHLYNK